MNPLLLYLFLLKATLISFSGLSSLPVIRHDLVVERQLLTDRQLNKAVAVARLTPGPLGLYLVCVGYDVAGFPGAAAGFLAMITPAFLAILMMKHLRRPPVRAVTQAAAGLIPASTIPLARDAIAGPFTAAIAVATLLVLVFTKIDTFWVILAAAVCGAGFQPA